MAFQDNREYFDALEKAGDGVRIKEQVDWDLEAGAIARRLFGMQGPAALMENIRDYPNQRIMTGVFSTFKRVATALGLDPNMHVADILDTYHERMLHPIKPVIVDKGPVQENVMQGDDVDLLKLAAPYVHDGDGGRYMTTWSFIVCKDPDTGWVNWGMYRQMIHNENTLGGLFIPSQDIGKIYYEKYEKRGEPMPFAAVIGAEPLTTVVACAPVGPGKDEVDFAGGLRQEPVPLVKCVSQDLYVPAYAEIVVEGVVNPYERVTEGPFGEYTGYRTSPRMLKPAYRVTAITFRNNPINTMANMGTPVDDCDIAWSVVWRADIKRVLVENGFPITGVHMPPEMVGHTVVVATKTPYSGIANKIASVIFGSKNTGLFLNQVIVVDEDTDPYDITQVFHAFATKNNPERQITVFPNMGSHGLNPYLNMHERTWNIGPKVCFDCTWPKDWSAERDIPVRSSFWDIYPERIVGTVLDKWEKYGF